MAEKKLGQWLCYVGVQLIINKLLIKPSCGREDITIGDEDGIRHITTAPYHPASNGLAERAVQTFKSLVEKSTGDSIDTKIARALFNYRITPQSTTGKSPAELLCGRKLRSTLDLIHPDIQGRVRGKQEKP